MSKSILIVICDFLIISLLSIASFDKKPDDKSVSNEKKHLVQKASSDDKLVNEVLKMEIDSQKQIVEQSSKVIEEKNAIIEEQKQISQKNLQDIKSSSQKQIETITLEKQNLQILQKDLENTISKKNEDLASIASTLAQNEKTSAQNLAKLALLQKNLQDANEKLNSTKKDLEQNLELSKTLQIENKNLEKQVAIKDTKEKLLSENIKKQDEQISILQTEKTKLMEHSSSLAKEVASELTSVSGNIDTIAKKTDIMQETIKDIKPLTASQIFDFFKQNLAIIEINSTSENIFGVVSKQTQRINSVLVEDNSGQFYWAFFNAKDTAFSYSNVATKPSSIEAKVFSGNFFLRMQNLYRLSSDGDILAFKVHKALAEKSQAKSYKVSKDPFKFNSCVLISTEEKSFGKAPIEVEEKSSSYAKIDLNFFQGIFGTFSFNLANLVFCEDNTLIGINPSGSKVIVLKDFSMKEALIIGENFSKEEFLTYQKESQTLQSKNKF